MHNTATIADELWYKDLSEEDKGRLDRLVGNFFDARNYYENSYLKGWSEAVVNAKKNIRSFFANREDDILSEGMLLDLCNYIDT